METNWEDTKNKVRAQVSWEVRDQVGEDIKETANGN